MYIVGVMSGSSLDGLDICLCRFSGTEDISWELCEYESIEFEESLRNKLAIASTLDVFSLSELAHEFSTFCAQKISNFIVLNKRKPEYIGSHGHTIFHYPEKGFTYQIGNPGTIAAKVGINCIGDFRINDIALGGQGAPLAPIVEKYLFPGYTYYLNLGGIANISCHLSEGIISWDVTPCNQVLNYYAEKLSCKYDDKGKIARSGKLNTALVQSLLQLDYFKKSPPKSLDNQWSKEHFIALVNSQKLSPEDSLRTSVSVISRLIAQDIESKGIKRNEERIFVTGGGAFNDFLIEEINNKLKHVNISCFVPNDDIVQMKEAILMALMAYLRVKNIPNTIPKVTGAIRASCAGAIYLA